MTRRLAPELERELAALRLQLAVAETVRKIAVNLSAIHPRDEDLMRSAYDQAKLEGSLGYHIEELEALR